MNRPLSSVLTVLLIAALNGARADEAAVLDKDFHTMMAWFPGVYDNQEQVYFEQEQEVDEALRHERIHHVFELVDLPAFGEHVFMYSSISMTTLLRYIASAFTPFGPTTKRTPFV